MIRKFITTLKKIFLPNIYDPEEYSKKFEGEYSFENIINFFNEYGVKQNKGASIDEINELEKKLNWTFPSDFKEYHQLSNGFTDWDMFGNTSVSIWDFKRIIEEDDHEYIKNGFIPFADYLIQCHHYGYIRGKNGIFNYKNKEAIASDFREFLELVIKDSRKLY